MLAYYNKTIKIMGNIVEIKEYTKPRLSYKKKNDKPFTLRYYKKDNIDNSFSYNPFLDTKLPLSSIPSENKKLIEFNQELLEVKKKKNKKDSIIRTKRKIYELCNCNCDLDKFLTLTYAENMVDRDRAIGDLQRFVRKINSLMCLVGKSFKYIAVLERQKRGAYHFHIMCNLDLKGFKILSNYYSNKKWRTPKENYIVNEKLKNLWGFGFVMITKPTSKDNNVSDLGAYMTKYIGKDIDDVDFGLKRYFNSKGLNKSVVIKINDDLLKSDYKLLDLYHFLMSNSDYYTSYPCFYDDSIIYFTKSIVCPWELYNYLSDIVDIS